jgi:hypothetical protein
MTAASSPEPAPVRPRSAGRLTGFGVMLALGLGAAFYVGSHKVALGWADAVALGLSLICIGAAVRLGIDSLDPATLGRRMEVEGDSTEKEARQARLQAVLLFALGVVLVLPPAAGVLGLGVPWIVYAAILVFVAVRIVYTRHVLRSGDEFVRQRIQRVQSVAFMVVQTGLLLYAGAERLGLAPRASAWEILVLVTLTVVLLPSVLLTRRAPAPAG